MTIVVKTISDSSLAQRDLKKLETSVGRIESTVQNASSTFAKLGAGLATSLAVVGTTTQLAKLSDTMTNLENKIKSVTDSTAKFQQAFQGVKDVAVGTRSDLNATAALYSRIALNQKEIGISTRSTLRVVEIVNKALKVSGTAAGEATSAVLQFGQAIGSGRLQGDELRSIGENAPLILKAIADSMGQPISAMKKLGEEGALVNSVVLPALLKAGDEIDKKFAGLKVTFGDAFTSLKTGATLLGDSIGKYFFGSENTIATWVNNVGLAMSRFAKHFEVNMVLAKNKVRIFVIDVLNLFDAILPAAKEVVKVIVEGVKDLYQKWAPELKKVLDVVIEWSATALDVIRTFYNRIIDSISSTELFQKIKAVLEGVRERLVNLFRGLLTKLNIKLPEIDIAGVFGKLEPVKTLILDFVKIIERAFFWLYDRVIGNSWVPDLVNGVKDWFNKLLGEPLAAIKKFTSTIDKRFAGLAVGGVLVLWTLYLRKFKTAIALVVGGLATLYALAPKMKVTDVWDDYSKRLEDVGANTETLRDKTKKLQKQLGSGFQSIGAAAKITLVKSEGLEGGNSVGKDKKPIQETPLERLTKTLGGLKRSLFPETAGKKVEKKETKETTLFERLTTGFQSSGASIAEKLKKERESKPGVIANLGDLFSDIAERLKIPLAIVVTGAMIVGVLAAFKSNAVRGALISLGTTAITGVTLANTKDGEVADAATSFVNKVLNVLEAGLTKLIGGNALFNPGSLLALIAKMALLFAAGRAMIGNALKAAVTLPTVAGRNVGLRSEVSYSNRRAREISAQATALPTERLNAVRAASDKLKSSVDALAKQSVNNSPLGRTAAIRAVNSGTLPGATPAQTQMLEASRNSAKVLAEQQAMQRQTTAHVTAMNTSAAQFRRNAALITRGMDDAKQARIEGMRNGLTGVGGVVGGVAGFQLGTEMAKGLSPDTPAWMKLSVQMGTAMAGQFMASAAMGLLFTKLLGVFAAGSVLFRGGLTLAMAAGAKLSSTILSSALVTGGTLAGRAIAAMLGAAALFANPVVLVVAGIAAAFAGAYMVWKALPEVWKTSLKNIFNEQAQNGTFQRAAAILDDPDNLKENLERESKRRAARGVLERQSEDGFMQNMTSKLLVSKELRDKKATVDKLLKDYESERDGTKPVDLDKMRKRPVSSYANLEMDYSSLSMGAPIKPLALPTVQKVDFLAKPKAPQGEFTGPPAPKVSALSAAIDSIPTEVMKLLPSSLRNMFAKTVEDEGKVPVAPSTELPTGVAVPLVDTVTSLKERLDNLDLGTGKGAKIFDTSVLNAAQLAGLTEVNSKDIEHIRATGDADSIDTMSKLTSEIAYFANVIKQKPGTAAARVAEGGLTESRAALAGFLVKNAFGDDEKDSFRKGSLEAKANKGKKDKALTLNEQFDLVTTAFPKLGLEFVEFERIADSTREALYKNATGLQAQKSAIDATIEAASKSGKPVETRKAREQLAAAQRDKLAESFARLNPERTFQKRTSVAFNNAGFGDSAAQLSRFASEGTISKYEPKLEQLDNIREALQRPDIANREELERSVDVIVEEVQRAIQRDTIDVLKNYEQASAKGSKIGISFDEKLFNKIVGNDLDIFTEALLSAYDISLEALANKGTVRGAQLQVAADDAAERLREMIAKFEQPTINTKVRIAGTGFAQSVSSDFGNAFSDALKGKTDGKHGVIKSFVLTFVDRFTNSVIDTFSKGLMEAVLGEDTKTFAWLKNLGGGLLEQGLDAGGAADPVPGQALEGAAGLADDAAKTGAEGVAKGGLAGLLSEPLKFLKDSLGSGIKGIASALGSIFEGIGPMIDKIGPAIASIGKGILGVFGFANGGYVSGKGTGTSDSIPAMLSNGEFVINAKATKRFAPLLQSINSGSFGSFAEGGLISTGMIAAPALANIKSDKQTASTSTQVVNVNITGDISRQTRAEIYGMLPSIAAGVNMHNHNSGYRGN